MNEPIDHSTATGYATGCRCDGCRTAKRTLLRIYDRANRRAVKAFKDRYPMEWEQFLNDAYTFEGMPRRGRGRPLGSTTRRKSEPVV